MSVMVDTLLQEHPVMPACHTLLKGSPAEDFFSLHDSQALTQSLPCHD